jgi:hypothetical protein
MTGRTALAIAAILHDYGNNEVNHEVAAMLMKHDSEIERLNEKNEALRSVLRVIAEQEVHELALDPDWCRRIANGGLDATR